jgi:hypothetical protein
MNKSNNRYIKEKKVGLTRYIINLDFVLEELNKNTFIALGIVPYSRIILGLILKNYIIFCAKFCKEINLIRNYTQCICVEERFPKLVKKMRSTGYLLKNFTFKNFYNRFNGSPYLIFYNITAHTFSTLNEENISYIGNSPKLQERVLTKFEFRKLLKELNLPHLKDTQISKEDFSKSDFDDLFNIFNSPFVCQRGDLDCGGEVATFFVHNKNDLETAKNVFVEDDRFSIVEINPYIIGNSYSMIGCATRFGTFTGPLQTQLIDIKESLRDFGGRGVFVGHDWGLRDWVDGVEEEAVNTVKKIGDYLYSTGYKGVFGIDFIYDKKDHNIYPIECNPRFTGSFPVISLINIMNGLPPFDLLHLIEHKNLNVDYNLKELDKDLKIKNSFSHILVTAEGIDKMPIDLPLGIYSYNENGFTYKRQALFPWEIEDDDEFLVIDSILEKGSDIGKGAFKLFKLIFPVSIAESSYQLKPKYSKIVKEFSDLLYDNELD